MVLTVKELSWLLTSLLNALYTSSSPSSISSKIVCGIGGRFISSEDPSRSFTTSPIDGLIDMSSCMHQNATLRAFTTSSSSATPCSLLSTTFRAVPFVSSYTLLINLLKIVRHFFKKKNR